MIKSRQKIIFFIVIFLGFHVLLMLYAWREDDNTYDEIKMVSTTSTSSPYTTTPYDAFTMDNHTKVHFSSLVDAELFMRKISLDKSPRVIIHYDKFSRKLPKFISNVDEELFRESDRNREYMEALTEESIRGVIEVIPNATFQMDYTCGYKSDYDFVRQERSYNIENKYEILVPLIIPMGFLFQHFFDGTVPKILQAHEFIKRDGVKILLERPNHRNVYHLLQYLDIKPSQVIWHRRGDTSTVYYANYMLMICVAPPLHPTLWTRLRKRLQVQDYNKFTYSERKVMLLTRVGAKNGGRNIINLDELKELLRERYNTSLLIFDGTYNVSVAVKVFQSVRLIIGSHGGAFYNLVYAPLDTSIVEFVPVLQYGRDIRSLPHAIFWALSDMLGMDYWRVQCLSQNFQHDIKVDIVKLRKILDVIDQQHQHRNTS